MDARYSPMYQLWLEGGYKEFLADTIRSRRQLGHSTVVSMRTDTMFNNVVNYAMRKEPNARILDGAPKGWINQPEDVRDLVVKWKDTYVATIQSGEFQADECSDGIKVLRFNIPGSQSVDLEHDNSSVLLTSYRRQPSQFRWRPESSIAKKRTERRKKAAPVTLSRPTSLKRQSELSTNAPEQGAGSRKDASLYPAPNSPYSSLDTKAGGGLVPREQSGATVSNAETRIDAHWAHTTDAPLAASHNSSHSHSHGGHGAHGAGYTLQAQAGSGVDRVGISTLAQWPPPSTAIPSQHQQHLSPAHLSSTAPYASLSAVEPEDDDQDNADYHDAPEYLDDQESTREADLHVGGLAIKFNVDQIVDHTPPDQPFALFNADECLYSIGKDLAHVQSHFAYGSSGFDRVANNSFHRHNSPPTSLQVLQNEHPSSTPVPAIFDYRKYANYDDGLLGPAPPATQNGDRSSESYANACGLANPTLMTANQHYSPAGPTSAPFSPSLAHTQHGVKLPAPALYPAPLPLFRPQASNPAVALDYQYSQLPYSSPASSIGWSSGSGSAETADDQAFSPTASAHSESGYQSSQLSCSSPTPMMESSSGCDQAFVDPYNSNFALDSYSNFHLPSSAASSTHWSPSISFAARSPSALNYYDQRFSPITQKYPLPDYESSQLSTNTVFSPNIGSTATSASCVPGFDNRAGGFIPVDSMYPMADYHSFYFPPGNAPFVSDWSSRTYSSVTSSPPRLPGVHSREEWYSKVVPERLVMDVEGPNICPSSMRATEVAVNQRPPSLTADIPVWSHPGVVGGQAIDPTPDIVSGWHHQPSRHGSPISMPPHDGPTISSCSSTGAALHAGYPPSTKAQGRNAAANPYFERGGGQAHAGDKALQESSSSLSGSGGLKALRAAKKRRPKKKLVAGLEWDSSAEALQGFVPAFNLGRRQDVSQMG